MTFTNSINNMQKNNIDIRADDLLGGEVVVLLQEHLDDMHAAFRSDGIVIHLEQPHHQSGGDDLHNSSADNVKSKGVRGL